MHNTGVTGNDCGGAAFQNGAEKLNVATYAKAAGYDTFYAGKCRNSLRLAECMLHLFLAGVAISLLSSPGLELAGV